jgi:hypothetical protein
LFSFSENRRNENSAPSQNRGGAMVAELETVFQLGSYQSGTDVMIFKIFSPKKIGEKIGVLGSKQS